MLVKDLIVPLSIIDIKPAAEMLARAFLEDPFFVFTIPDPARRLKVMPWLLERQILYTLRYGAAFAAGGLAGAALWLKPGHPGFAFWGALQTGLCLLPFKLTPQEFRLCRRLSDYAANLHRLAIQAPHWYLVALGVDPAVQGQGIGRALLQPVLDLADRQGLPCYLETNNDCNIPFYERSGFAVRLQGRSHPAGPGVWGMLREVRRNGTFSSDHSG